MREPIPTETIEADNSGKSNGDTAREIVRFEREDWTRLRTVQGLQQQAGVPPELLRRLVIKEIADNGLDEGNVSVGQTPDGGYFVEDDGRGFDGTPDDIARMFSIDRPLISTKLWRLPTRGAQGNGLRVAAGAVFASNGSLVVTTRGKRIKLRPEHDGSTKVVSWKPVKNQVGTRIEISFGPHIPEDKHALYWANVAMQMNRGDKYAGKSSPWWYDASEFHDLLLASNVTVREMVLDLEGCARNAGEIVAEARLARVDSADVTRKQSDALLKIARRYARAVSPKRLGAVRADLFPRRAYATSSGEVSFGVGPLQANIPFTIEALATEQAAMSFTCCVNRTPVSGNIHAERSKREINLFGCGLQNTVTEAPKDKTVGIFLNIMTPFMPSTSNSKEPNLKPFLDAIQEAVSKAVQRATRKDTSQDDSLLPKRGRGQQSDDAITEYDERVERFCRLILQIKSTMDFAVGSRGWCYILERHGLRKGEFKAAEKFITTCRKSGALPLDICAEDEARKTIGVQEISDLGINDEAARLIDELNNAHKDYVPISFWDDQKYYVEVAVEKLDLRNLFEPVCKEFHVPIQNFKGWSDLNARAAMMRRFKYWESRGKICVLLLCGDHDPGGLHITDKMRKNLADLSGAVGWTPANLKQPAQRSEYVGRLGEGGGSRCLERTVEGVLRPRSQRIKAKSFVIDGEVVIVRDDGTCPLLLQWRPDSGHSGIDAMCHKMG